MKGQATISDLSASWDEAIAGLRKSIGTPVDEGEPSNPDPLRKAKGNDPAPEEDQGTPAPEEGDEEEDEDEEEMQKSLSDLMSEDESSDAAMDVAPFLRQLVKSINTKFEQVSSVVAGVAKEVESVQQLQKSLAEFSAQSAELQKSLFTYVEEIGSNPVPSTSVQALKKSIRFGEEDKSREVTPAQILAKSVTWRRNDLITSVEAGKIESRVNKGLLMKSGDALDKKVEQLLSKEDK